MNMLLCSDGSEQAERAVRLGAAIAGGAQAQVTLLGIVENPADSKPLLAALQRSQHYLQERKIAYELVSTSGQPIAEIMKRTEENHYDLVVIGAPRKQAGGRFWVASKAYKIIKEIKPPVLSVSGKNTTLKRILICSGGKGYIEPAVRLTAEIAKAVGAEVTLLHVLPELPAIYSGLPRLVESSAAILNSGSELGRNLRQEKEMLESFNIITDVVVRQGAVLEEILREIHVGKYDMVVTGSALSRSLRTYVLGDITREIVNRIGCAVLVVRSHRQPRRPIFSFKMLLGRRITK